MAQKANLVIDQGSDFSTTIDVADDEGNAIDLSSFTSAGQIRKHYTSLTFVSFNVSTTASGILTISLDANTSNNMEPGRYVYDVELTSNTGSVTRILEGIVTITPSVTR
jgi:hypothetical protein